MLAPNHEPSASALRTGDRKHTTFVHLGIFSSSELDPNLRKLLDQYRRHDNLSARTWHCPVKAEWLGSSRQNEVAGVCGRRGML
jgi:hypothetical protein